MSDIDEVIYSFISDYHDFKYIDYTDRLLSIDRYYSLMKRTIDPLYSKYLFKFDLKKVLLNCDDDSRSFFKDLLKKYYKKNSVVIYNGKNHISIDNSLKANISFIKKFIDTNNIDSHIDCVICFENCNNLFTCRTCISPYCDVCFKKIIKKKYCCVCRNKLNH